MSTQTSQLITNLTQIYNTKLQIKAAIGTNSDDFTEYPELIQEAISEGGGGSGEVVDPWYGSVWVNDMVENEETTADYYKSIISDNFSAAAVEEGGEPTGEYEDISWDEIAEFEEGGEPVEKIVHVIITGDPHGQSGTAGAILSYGEDYPDIYGNIYPILENVTLTISEDPSNDGYDYLIEGDLYAWNLNTCDAGVDEITENGFYPEDGWFGFDVNVPTGKQIDNNLCAYLFAPDYNNLDISGEQYVPRYYTSFSFFDQEADTTTNHDDVITAEVDYISGPEGAFSDLSACSYVQNLNANWFNDVNNMGEGWFKFSFNYTGSEPIYIKINLAKATYQSSEDVMWNIPSGYNIDFSWEDGVNFIDDDDSPSMFTIPGAGYYYFYICAGTFDGTSGTYSRSFRPCFENTSEFITPRVFFGE